MNKLKGHVNASVGKVKQATGRALNDRELEAKGFVQKTKGEIQKASQKIGHTLEKTGKRITS